MHPLYLDNAATSFPRPAEVVEALSEWGGQGSAAGRGSHAETAATDDLVLACRTAIAELTGTDSARHVVLTSGCTESLNTVLLGLLRDGDSVIASRLDHNSVLRPLHHLQQTRGVSTRLLDFDPESGILNPDQLEQLLADSPVRLVVLNHGSNVIGTIQPLEQLAAIAKAAGALVLVDAAQTAGHETLSFTDWQIDFLSLAGHKGIPGPLGTGALCIKPGREDLLQPLMFGGTGTQSESALQPSQCPEKFESGNRNTPGIAGLLAAANWIRSQTPEAVGEQVRTRSQQLRDGLARIAGVRVFTPDSGTRLCGPVAFQLDGLSCHDAAVILDEEFGIQCRAGLHCAPLVHDVLGTSEQGGCLRFSPGPFLTEADIQRAISAVAELIGEVV